jgi:HEAT repeat protein
MSTNEQTNEMDSLIADFANDHGRARQHARESLVAIGRPAVGPLMQALQHEDWRMRWGAAKALGQIADPVAADALVKTLEDRWSGIRWLAAEGVIALGRAGLAPMLQALMHHSDSMWLREGAHHVIHSLTEKHPDLSYSLAPVSAALEDIEPEIQVPPAAQAALTALAQATGQQGR